MACAPTFASAAQSNEHRTLLSNAAWHCSSSNRQVLVESSCETRSCELGNLPKPERTARHLRACTAHADTASRAGGVRHAPRLRWPVRTCAQQGRPARLLVLQDLAALHGAHDGRVDLVAPVAVHVLHHLLALVARRQRQLRGSRGDQSNRCRECLLEHQTNSGTNSGRLPLIAPTRHCPKDSAVRLIIGDLTSSAGFLGGIRSATVMHAALGTQPSIAAEQRLAARHCLPQPCAAGDTLAC